MKRYAPGIALILFSLFASLSVIGLCHADNAPVFQLGIGKALNNTNARLPGYAASITATYGHLTASYLRMGKSQVGEDAAISTVGYSYSLPSRPISFSLSVVTGASYSAAVWWDQERPDEECGPYGRGCEHSRRYDNDGAHFSRACHMCGGAIGVQYNPSRHVFVRLDYFGIRHMTPTFQGLVITTGLAF
jgi:hypothetical protein